MILWSVTKETKTRPESYCTFLVHVHLVCVARNRRKIFDQDAIEKLQSDCDSVSADFDVERVDIDGEGDHVHLVIEYPPNWQYQIWSTAPRGVQPIAQA